MNRTAETEAANRIAAEIARIRRRTAAADRRAVEAAPAPALDSTALDRLAARFGTDTGTAVPWMYR